MPRKVKGVSYRQSGVDVEAAERFVREIRKFMPQNPRLRAFAAFFDSSFIKKREHPYLVSSCDGVGTKLKLAQALGRHNTIGIDLVAMNVNDIVCCGATPLFFLDYIACGKLNLGVLGDIVEGVYKGLKEAECVLLGGETAEMPGVYKRGEYDLAGFCVGVVEKKEIVDGHKIKKGDLLLGLSSSGLHSNGFSLVRKVLSRKQIRSYAEELLEPTRIYVKTVRRLLARFNKGTLVVKGIAHITGGAFYNKLTKLLPEGLGFVVDKRSWPVPEIFRFIQKEGNISEKEMYAVFNMGIGMVLVVDKKRTQRVLSSLKNDNDIDVFIIGEVVQSSRKISFLS